MSYKNVLTPYNVIFFYTVIMPLAKIQMLKIQESVQIKKSYLTSCQLTASFYQQKEIINFWKIYSGSKTLQTNSNIISTKCFSKNICFKIDHFMGIIGMSNSLRNIKIAAYNKLNSSNEGEALYSFVYTAVISKSWSYLFPLQSLLPPALHRN